MTRKIIAALFALIALASTPVVAEAAAPRVVQPSGAPTRVVAKPLPKPASRIEAGSAGVPGYDDAKCGQLADFWEGYVVSAEYAIQRGDTAGADFASQEAADIMSTLEDKCMVTGIG
jgi:hypothetical protein